MNLHKILATAVLGLTAWAATADARYVFSLPSAGSATNAMVGYTDQFLPTGSVTVPVGASQVFVDNSGSKAIVVALSNPASPVSFVNIQGGVFAGAARNVNLDNQPALMAALTPDGTRLLVLTGTTTTYLYVIDLASEQVVANGRYSIDGVPKDFVVTEDSTYVVVLSGTQAVSSSGQPINPAILTQLNLATAQVVKSVAVTGISSLSPVALSLAPSGSIYVSGLYVLAEYFLSSTGLTENGRTAVYTNPGKMMFSPDGRYAVAPNRAGNNLSLVSFDLQNRSGVNLAGTQTGTAVVSSPGVPVVTIDKLLNVTGTWALGYSSTTQKLYSIAYNPTLSGAAEWTSLTQLSGQPILGVAATNEFISRRYIYVTSGSLVYRYDVVANMLLEGKTGSGGAVEFAAPANAAAGAKILAYGGNQTPVAGARLQPYYVRVVDSNDRPAYNQTVTFSTTTGVGLSNTTGVTNVNGYAWVTATAPAAGGAFSVLAQCGTASVLIDSVASGGTGGGGGGTPVNPSGPQIQKVAGDGQLVMITYSLTQPLVVRIVDANGVPLAGRTVSWSDSGGVNYRSPQTTTTDDKGLVTMEWTAGGELPNGAGYLAYSIVASSEFGNVTFSEVAYPLPTLSGYRAQPQVYLVKPTQDAMTLTVKLGNKYPSAIQTLVMTDSSQFFGNQAIPGVGTRVYTLNTDATQGPVAGCDGGIILSGTDGTANCDLVVTGLVGSANVYVNVGTFREFGPVNLIVTPGDPIAPPDYSGQ